VKFWYLGGLVKFLAGFNYTNILAAFHQTCTGLCFHLET